MALVITLRRYEVAVNNENRCRSVRIRHYAILIPYAPTIDKRRWPASVPQCLRTAPN
jgi:hypothetical protein